MSVGVGVGVGVGAGAGAGAGVGEGRSLSWPLPCSSGNALEYPETMTFGKASDDCEHFKYACLETALDA